MTTVSVNYGLNLILQVEDCQLGRLFACYYQSSFIMNNPDNLLLFICYTDMSINEIGFEIDCLFLK